MTVPILDTRLKALEELRWHVGNTPLHSMLRLSPKEGVEIYAKLEWQQFGGSLKARAAYDIISKATISGALNGRRLIDASSGNTGIAFGIFGAIANIPVTICIQEDSTKETKHMLRTLGVEIIETNASDGILGARDKALDLSQTLPDKYCFVDQLTHDSSVSSHFNGTGKEIWFETGDLLVNINVWTPQELTKDERKALEGLRDSSNFKPDPNHDERGFFDKVRDLFS